jgi:hypothetical protein
MNGNFSRLNLQGDKLGVEGWLTWDAPDDSAVLRITLTQGASSVTSDPIKVSKGDDRWDTTLNSGVFQKGLAAGQAGATVLFKDGTTAPQNWNSGPLRVE